MLKAVHGQIKWSYRVAAQLNGLVVTCSKPPEKKWALRGTATQVDAMAIGQRPLMLVVPHQHGQWRWPIQSLERNGDVVSAELGPPME